MITAEGRTVKLLIVNNASSGLRDGSIYDFARLAARDGDEICIRTTDGSTDAATLVHDAEAFDAVVVSGGDGTIASVAYALANTDVPILPFPAGTGNLLAGNLASPNEPNALVKLLNKGKHLDFDLGEIESHGKKHGFLIMAGAGFDAAIMKTAIPAKKILGPMAYFQAAVANATPQVSKITLDIDGARYEREGVGVVLANFSKMQFDISITHENHPRDGKLDVVVLKTQNAFELIPAVLASWRDREGTYPSRTDSLEIISGSTVRVECNPPMNIQYDGEVPGLKTPFNARVMPGAARLLLSDEGFASFSDEAEF